MEPLTTIRPELLTLSWAQFQALGPYLALLAAIVLGLFFAVAKLFSPKWPVFVLSALGLLGAAYSALCLSQGDTVSLFNGMMISDPFSNLFNLIFLLSALVTVLVSVSYLDKESLQMPEFYILILFSTLGMMFMVSSLDLIVLFIGLEIMSLSVYTLVGFRRADRRSTEASIKYFVLGGVASAVLLYGVALLYGATGSMNILQILEWVRSGQPVGPLFSLGAVLITAGFLFKVAAVPFHMWMPDVYEGAPSPVTGLMTTGVKAASFAAMAGHQ